MKRHIATITDVAEFQLCCGCGVCAYVQPDDIRMVDDFTTGRRPIVRSGADTTAALSVCPGIELEHRDHPAGADPALLDAWGPVLEVWEGHATDPEIRFAGSSGGIATALSLFGSERKHFAGTLHTRQRADVPILNETVLSGDRSALLAASGSRYAPASPCDGLQQVVDQQRPVAFVGKPCDVAGLERTRRCDAELDARIGVTIAIFCAGAPSTDGTLSMLHAMAVSEPQDLSRLRYRGNGWPGRATAEVRHGAEPRSLSYQESWDEILQQHRPWRCRLCIDHSGEFADIAVGDPWYRPVPPGAEGSSLVVVRTERGRKYLADAIELGYVELQRVDHDLLPRSQPNLARMRGFVYGRVATLRLIGMPTPRYLNMPARRQWRDSKWTERVRSIPGTLQRARTRRVFRRRPVILTDLAPYRVPGAEDDCCH